MGMEINKYIFFSDSLELIQILKFYNIFSLRNIFGNEPNAA